MEKKVYGQHKKLGGVFSVLPTSSFILEQFYPSLRQAELGEQGEVYGQLYISIPVPIKVVLLGRKRHKLGQELIKLWVQ